MVHISNSRPQHDRPSRYQRYLKGPRWKSKPLPLLTTEYPANRPLTIPPAKIEMPMAKHVRGRGLLLGSARALACTFRRPRRNASDAAAPRDLPNQKKFATRKAFGLARSPRRPLPRI